MSSLGRTVPGRADAAQVVAGEVDQHRVLRALLRVGEQLVLVQTVAELRLAARTRAGDRAGRDRPSLDADQRLRRRAGELETQHPHEEHVRGGVRDAEPAVDGEPAAGVREPETRARARPGRCRRPRCGPSSSGRSRGSGRRACSARRARRPRPRPRRAGRATGRPGTTSRRGQVLERLRAVVVGAGRRRARPGAAAAASGRTRRRGRRRISAIGGPDRVAVGERVPVQELGRLVRRGSPSARR